MSGPAAAGALTEANRPLLSICVPTHDGRRATLAALLDSVAAQADSVAGLVEVCISDNASNDGTSAFLAGLAERVPFRIAYLRHGQDRGLARNLMSAVELAGGEYCWLLGSDDLLAPDALRRACALLRAHPGAPGYAVGAIHVDAADPGLRARALPRAFHPPGETTRIIEGLDEVLEGCGNSWCALSWSIVEREAWLAAVSRQRDTALVHPVFPQVVILAAMAIERPRWGWLAEPLVLQRNATTFLFEGRDSPLTDRWRAILSGAAAAWGAVLGTRLRRRWRRRMRRLQLVWGGAADMRGAKLYAAAGVGSQLRLALTCLFAFWPARSYWRDVLWATIMPRWLTLRRYAPDSRSRLATVPPEAADVALMGAIETSMRAGGCVAVAIVVENAGRRSVYAAGPGAVTIGQRWRAEDGRLLAPDELALNELASLPQSLPRAVRPGRCLEVPLSLYPPPRTGRYRLELVAHNQQLGWLGEENPRALLVADIDVAAAEVATPS